MKGSKNLMYLKRFFLKGNSFLKQNQLSNFFLISTHNEYLISKVESAGLSGRIPLSTYMRSTYFEKDTL